MASFKNLKMNASFDITVESLSPIHIGTNSSNNNDNEMVKHEYGDTIKFVITGSSVKGIIRSYLSDLSMYFDEGKFSEAIDDLFGMALKKDSIKGRIFVSDMEFDKEAQGVKTINAIPRLSARNPSIITYEVIRPNTKWVMHIEIFNPTEEDFGLIGLFLKALHNESIQIGHSKSRGFGRVRLHQVDVMLEHFTSLKEPNSIQNILPLDVTDWTKEQSLISMKYSKSFENEQAYQWLQFGVDKLAEKVVGGV